MKQLTKIVKITVKGKTKAECEQFFQMLKGYCDVEIKEVK